MKQYSISSERLKNILMCNSQYLLNIWRKSLAFKRHKNLFGSSYAAAARQREEWYKIFYNTPKSWNSKRYKIKCLNLFSIFNEFDGSCKSETLDFFAVLNITNIYLGSFFYGEEEKKRKITSFSISYIFYSLHCLSGFLKSVHEEIKKKLEEGCDMLKLLKKIIKIFLIFENNIKSWLHN